MRKLGAIVLLATGFAFGIVPSAEAHHSLSAFDYTTEITLEGTVTKFLFGNPHTFLHIAVTGEDGEVVVWAAEMSSVQNMARRGVRGSTFKVGDVVTLSVNPMKSGSPGGKYTSVTAADGKTYQ
jgi:hypothetical protein